MGLEQGAFRFGAVKFPLTASTDNALIDDVDPALATALDFLACTLDTYIGQRLKTESALHEQKLVHAVAHRLDLEPTPFLLSDDFRFPLFALYRVKDVWDEHTVAFDKSTSTWQFAYVLPALTPVEAKKLHGILRGVSVTLRRAIHRGADPSYKDDAPVWNAAGVMKARLVECVYGGYEALADNPKFFRALTGTIAVLEREMPVPEAFDQLEGTKGDIDLKTDDEPVYQDIVELATQGPPTLTSITPAIGSVDGGTSVVVRGSGFRVGTRPRLLFDGAAADAVRVIDATTITCITPPHTAYPTFVADLLLIPLDLQRAKLPQAFTFQAA